MALVSLRAYSRHRGVTLRAVQKAIESNRISLIDGKIDPEIADFQWAKNTRPDQQERGSLKDFEKTQKDIAGFSAGQDEPLTVNGSGNLSNEKAGTESIRRKLLELQLAQRNGELVKVQDVERAMSGKLKAASEALNSIADRLAPKLAAETDVDKVDEILRSEIRRAMQMISQEAPVGVN